jgi:predicted GNAT family N-acyltransferase
MLTVKSCTGKDELLAIAFQIREKVFVEEQHVPANEEYDEYDQTARHFLAYFNDVPCGTARWRYTDKGIKLERFAVLSEFRSQKVGSALVQHLLDDVHLQPEAAGMPIYLHAQLTAIPLYEKFGFRAMGEQFMECDIAHYKMMLENP